MKDKLTILILKDSFENAEILEHELRKTKIDFVTRHVSTRESFISEIEENSPDIIISDYALQSFHGTDALGIAREKMEDTPFIFVVKNNEEETAVSEALESGASDYVIENRLLRLPFIVKRMMREFQERESCLKIQNQLRDSAGRYRELIDMSADAFITINEKREIIQWNRTAGEIFGYSSVEAIGSLIELIIPEKNRQDHINAFNKFLEKGHGKHIGTTLNLEGKQKDGSLVPVELSLSVINLQGSYIFTAIIRDITARTKAEEELARKLDELERFRKVTVGRELQMSKLKDKINKLEAIISKTKEKSFLERIT